MKTILLVDDEFPARKLVRSMLDWEQCGFAIAHEAKNGAEALQLYRQHKPDLIISDIQMPVMDGLELLSAIREEDEGQLFIVLSCYERFDYARQVVRLGSLDYLIKDTLTPEILYAALQHAREKLEPEPSAPALPIAGGEAPDAPYSRVLAWWLQTGDTPAAAHELHALAPSPDSPYMVVSLGLDLGDSDASAVALAGQLALLPGFAQSCGCAVAAPDVLLLLGTLPAGEAEAQSARYALLNRVKSALEERLKTWVTMGVSTIYTGFDGLPRARVESEDALRYRLFMGTGNILFYNPLQNTSHTIQHMHMETRIFNLRAAMAENDLAAVQVELDKLYSTELHGVMHLHYLEYLNAILWGMLTEEHMLRGQFGLSPEGFGRHVLDGISQMERVEDMNAAFFALFSSLLQQRQRQTGADYSQRVRHIMQYISDHLEEDIGLESIAAEFQLHKTHLARLFKEETGTGINEFIRRGRIERAKTLLLNSQYRVNEIVYKVGFNNPQNFYTLFTRYVGLTPKAFRDKYG